MDDNVLLTSVVRSLGAAWRSLLLYPAASPMTFEAATVCCKAVEDYLNAEPSLRLDVVRGGFILRGIEGVLTAPGVADLADAFGLHGIGEVHFVAPPMPEELLALLGAVRLTPQESHAQGGVRAALNAANADAIKVVSVTLNKHEAPPEIPEEEAEKFLAELAGDPDRLAVWLRSLLSADDEGLVEGIMVLANAAGDVRVFGRTLALAFQELDGEDRDRLLEVSIQLEPLKQIMTEMLANLSAVELTAAIRGGCYGENLLSLSYMLAWLPLGERTQEILSETEAALNSADAGPEEIAFLRNMIARRRSGSIEPPLVESQPYYASAQAAITLSPAQTAAAVGEAAGSMTLDGHGAQVVLYLLDTSESFESYRGVLGALARAVPRLLEARNPELALWIVSGICTRSSASDHAWPGLDTEFSAAMETMCGPRSMHALVATYRTDPTVVEHARQLVTFGGDVAGRALAAAAMESEAEGSFEIAQQVLGRRLAEMLAPQVTVIEASQAARLAELLAREGSQYCLQALGQLIARPEDKVRMEAARGIVAAGGQALTLFVPRLLRDFSPTVSSFSARILARRVTPEIIDMLASRLDEIETDKDLTLPREIISILGKSPSPVAEAALRRVTERGGLLKKAKSAELRRMAAEALASRPQGGVA